jgi:methyl-accepting chemotaxis protein
MAVLNRIPFSKKLPTIITTLCLTASLSIAVVGYLDFKRNTVEQARQNFQVLTESRGDALLKWMENIGADVVALGTDPTVVGAINAFNSSYSLMIDSAGLQAAYVTNNPNPPGSRDLFDQAPESVPYNYQHARFQPFFRQLKNTKGYYDVFLFNLQGDLMYSVFKESDFATNFDNGPYAKSGLASAYSAARSGDAGQIYFADFLPYAPSDGAAASFLASPVIGETGQVIGVVAVQVPANQIDVIVNNPVGLGESGEVYVVGDDLTTRSVSRFDNGHQMLQNVDELPQVARALEGGTGFLEQTTGVSGAQVLSKTALIDVFDAQWGIVGEVDYVEVNAPAVVVRNKMIAVTLFVGGLSTILGWLTARSVVVPLERLGAAMQSISDRDYEIELADQARGDEIGRLSKELMRFRDKLQASENAEEERKALQAEQVQIVGRLSTALTKLADGDLTHTIKTPFYGEYDQLRQNFNRTVDNLNETIGAVVARAGDIRQRSDDVSKSSDDLSRRTENQAATLEETAAALDQLTASVRSAATGATEVEGVVANAQKDAQASEPVVRNAVQAMTKIEGSSQEISQIIGVIDDIAFQTNLLALNAGVEAARAGDAGRGFAVVASEVRALAQRSSDAAKQIKTLISASSDQVEHGVSLVGQAGEVLTKIAGHISHISGLVEEIAAGAQEQSIGLGEINIGVTQLDKVTQQNAAMVEQATASSHALNADAGELAERVMRFRLRDTVGRPMAVDNIMTFKPQRAMGDLETPSGDAPAELMPRKAVGAQTRSEQQADAMWQDF